MQMLLKKPKPYFIIYLIFQKNTLFSVISMRHNMGLEAGIKKLKIVSDYALKAGKLAAFTETGLKSIPNPTWWTETLLKAMRSGKMQLCYVLVWRNDMRSPTHFYAPFPGQVSEADFIKFYNDPYTLFD